MLLCALSTLSFQYAPDVEKVLLKAGKNRSGLEAVLTHYQHDSLKYKAACFLIGNMDIHYSQTYHWADSLGHIVPFDELDYPDFSSSQIAFSSLRERTPGIHPVQERIPDIFAITSDYLIDNIDRAFQTWNKNGRNVTFNDFCEYILPYRISVEPVQQWREKYGNQFGWLPDSLRSKTSNEAYTFFDHMLNKEFENIYKQAIVRKEPLPRFGALQLMSRKKGLCEDASAYGVFMLRSQGYPASVDVIPYWATASGNHTLWHIVNVKQIPLFDREPSKVIRTTYSRQPDVLANFEKQENIPDNFLQSYNYKDVTPEYWRVKNIVCKPDSLVQGQTIYACVLNYRRWEPTWWATVKGDSAVFTNMTLGVVYLPVYYRNERIVPAAYPVAFGYYNQLVLKPNFVSKRNVVLEEQDKYLKFRPGKKYTLFYWDKEWKELETQTADVDTHQLVFNNVPSNALLILIPDYSERKERPFIITDKGARVWF